MRQLRLVVLITGLFFAGVWYGRWRERATAPPPPQPRPPSRQEIVDGFHKIYYDASTYTWSATRWLGAPVLKNPLDLWVMQEIVYETRPNVIIEEDALAGPIPPVPKVAQALVPAASTLMSRHLLTGRQGSR